MDFVLDENVPVSVRDMLVNAGHSAQFIREFIPEGSPDELVATVTERMNAILISFDGDFKQIAPRIPAGARRRFKRLSRIRMQCSEFQAAARLESALSFIDAEYQIALAANDSRMQICVATGFLKTIR